MISSAVIFRVLLKQWKIVLAIIFLLLFLAYAKLYLKERSERIRFENNYDSQVQGVQKWKDQYNREHARVIDLQLEKKEITNSKDSVIQSIVTDHDLTKKKLKRINSIIHIQKITTNTILIPLKDTIVTVHKMPVKAMTTSFNDGYLNFTALVYPDSLQASYTYTDEITIFDQWERNPDAFFLWRWLGFARKIHTKEVVSSNPSSTVNVKSIVVKKKRKQR